MSPAAGRAHAASALSTTAGWGSCRPASSVTRSRGLTTARSPGSSRRTRRRASPGALREVFGLSRPPSRPGRSHIPNVPGGPRTRRRVDGRTGLGVYYVLEKVRNAAGAGTGSFARGSHSIQAEPSRKQREDGRGRVGRRWFLTLIRWRSSSPAASSRHHEHTSTAETEPSGWVKRINSYRLSHLRRTQ